MPGQPEHRPIAELFTAGVWHEFNRRVAAPAGLWIGAEFDKADSDGEPAADAAIVGWQVTTYERAVELGLTPDPDTAARLIIAFHTLASITRLPLRSDP